VTLDGPQQEKEELVTLSPVARPRVVAIRNSHGFTHLVRTRLEDLDLAVRSSAVNQSAVHLVEERLLCPAVSWLLDRHRREGCSNASGCRCASGVSLAAARHGRIGGGSELRAAARQRTRDTVS
jgi:hypothetical protein